MYSILCIDDTPDEIIDASTGTTLKKIIEDIYKSSPYKIFFETQGDKGIKAVGINNDIKLVLLDVELKRQEKQGDEIAKELLKVRPELKVIVLTRKTETGNKISFGHKINVIHYVIKKNISLPDAQSKLKNLSQAIIEDYKNKNWSLEYVAGTLTLSRGEESFGINIPITAEEAIKDCLQSPNKPVNLSAPSYLNKARNMINRNALEATNWKIWGILTREDCAKGQLKLVIGSVGASSSASKETYVTLSQFEKFEKLIKEINNRLDKIEQTLKIQ